MGGETVTVKKTRQPKPQHEERRIPRAPMEPDRFHAFVEGAVDAVFQGDAAGRFMAVNEQGCILAGYSREELLAMSMADLFSPGELSRAALRYDVLSEGKTITAERLLTRKDGTVVPVEMKSKRMPDGTYQ